MMTPEEKGSLPIRVEKLFYELQDRIFTDIVRRIRKTKKITSTADYQINKLLLLGDSTEFIEAQLKELLEISDPEIWELYDQVCDWEYVRNREAYEQINGNFIPLEDNETIRKWSNAIVKQTQNEIRNLTRSMGMTVDMGGGKVVFTPLATYYQKYLDRACMDIVTGSFDYNTVLRRVVKELSSSGLQTIDYASGWKNRAPVAARRAILTGVSQLSAQINEQVAKDLHTDKYEVSWHAGHRPSHWWGGRVYTYQELQSVCGLGDGDGLCGWNCRHSYYAFLEGFSVRTYTDEQLAAMEEKEQSVRTYQGKQYNAYQASQAQRQMETTMRAQRTKVRQLQQGDGSKDDILAAKARYLNTLHQYQAFSRKMELPEQMERVYMDGLGRVAGGRRMESRISNIKKETAANIINVQIVKEMDTVVAANVCKNLKRSQTGKSTLEYIQKQSIPVDILYDKDTVEDLGLGKDYGTCYDGHIYINGRATGSIQKIAETIIHETKHMELNIGYDQHSEAVCDYYAMLHTKGKLTANDIRSIIKSVKERYPEYKWRK